MIEVLSWILFIYVINFKIFKYRGVIFFIFGEYILFYCFKVLRNIFYGEMDIFLEIVVK